MNLKNVLIGAATLLAVTPAARAADAILGAEPEAQDHVTVCDAFGTGYFYIPGTETCLQIGGYVRHDLRGGELLGRDTDGDGAGDAWSARTRFSLRLSTAADTDIGALKTFVDARFNVVNGVSTAPVLYAAYIDVAGFRIGKDESSFVTFSGKAGAVLNDDLIPYGSYETQLISYSFDAGNGFSALMALEDDGGDGEGYVPNAVLGVKYKGDAFSASLTGAYDEAAEDAVLKARVDGKIGAVSLFLMGAWNSGDTANFYANWRGDWALWTGASVKLADSATLNAQVSLTEREDFAAAAGVGFKLASGFTVTPELAYSDRAGSSQRFGGMVRFQRSF